MGIKKQRRQKTMTSPLCINFIRFFAHNTQYLLIDCHVTIRDLSSVTYQFCAAFPRAAEELAWFAIQHSDIAIYNLCYQVLTLSNGVIMNSMRKERGSSSQGLPHFLKFMITVATSITTLLLLLLQQKRSMRKWNGKKIHSPFPV
jgi:hypothetical protein